LEGKTQEKTMIASSMKTAALVLAVGLSMAGLAAAQQAGNSPASKSYMDAMSKMQSSMPKDHTGDADKDFARMMIPHHQGAIDMAKVESQYGKDPMLKSMAAKMIKDQEKEVADLQKWLKDHAK
jgi:uncharacterized protein (DUF305 family)